MAEITYYAMLRDARQLKSPAGLVRRIVDEEGVADEGLKRDLTWGPSPLLVESERGDLTYDFVQISEDEAAQIIQRFRERWGVTQ
jgi:hypothetical protein